MVPPQFLRASLAKKHLSSKNILEFERCQQPRVPPCLSPVMQGITDTTFFVLTVYFGSVRYKKYHYSIVAVLTADITGFIASVCICNLIFK